MCKCHETDYNCRQGRDCPIEYAGDEPFSFGSLALAIGITAAIVWICWLAMPELRGLLSIVGN